MRSQSQNEKLDIGRIVFIGRTYEEYLSMFNLSLNKLKDKKILDCPAGACSFTSIGRKHNLNIEACDIAYAFNTTDLYNKGREDLKHTIEKMELSESNYSWNYFENINGLKEHRLQALEDCSYDMSHHPESYQVASLPKLPYIDNKFDILLSAHFLFMYSDSLEYNFHKETIDEMLRVTSEEIRIFPVVNLEGKRYDQLDNIIKYLSDIGYKTEEVKVNYEFQTNANTMLKIKK